MQFYAPLLPRPLLLAVLLLAPFPAALAVRVPTLPSPLEYHPYHWNI